TEPPCPSRPPWWRALSLDPNLLQSLLVGVFAVVFADVLEKRVIRHPAIGIGDGPRLLERDGILHRDLVPQDVGCDEMNPFLDSQLFGVRRVLVSNFLFDPNGIHHPPLALPVPGRGTVKSRLDIVDGLLRSIEQDPADLRKRLLDYRDLALALEKLDRKHRRHHGGHAVRKTVRIAGSQRLTPGPRFASRLHAGLPLLQVFGLERRRWVEWRDGRIFLLRLGPRSEDVPVAAVGSSDIRWVRAG